MTTTPLHLTPVGDAGEPPAEAEVVALVARLQRGDRSATRDAWRRFAPLVRRIVTRTLGPSAEVDDVCQEVFITFFERITTLREARTAPAFIMSITAFKIRHHLRWRRVRRWLSFRGHVQELDMRPMQQDPDAREALQRFFQILDRLSPVDRTAFSLRHLEEMELRDVAAALGLSLATTKRRLSRTWDRLSVFVKNDPTLKDLLPDLPGAR
jgi:RNA polymerase sigma-70 factor, ECF subfamily